jgi:glycosyltransferase involved in cell wall biosynthesis
MKSMNKKIRKTKLRIALLGTRGIPASYGGFETFAEQLSVRLAERGHEVTVYGRSNYIRTQDKTYRGVRLVVLPNVMHKYLDTPVHTLLCTLHALFRRYDVYFYCNSANAFSTLLPRIAGKKVVLNVDGMEWKRAKWNAFGKAVYRVSEYMATVIPQSVVTDARSVQEYYEARFRKRSVWIPYGTPSGRLASADTLKPWGLKKNGYILYVSRLEPENNAHAVIHAYEMVRGRLPLVIVGDAPFSTEYIRSLKSTRDTRVLFTGYIFGKGYHELQSHARCYIQATEVGGTHPALVEAMGHGNCVLANDVPEHREVLADAGLYFEAARPETLARQIEWLLARPSRARAYGKAAFERARIHFSWDRVTDDYERLFLNVARKARA